MISPDDITAAVKDAAIEAGFARVGIASVEEADGEGFRAWLDEGRHGEMAYLARNVDKRLAPAKLVPGSRSVICLVVPYAPATTPGDTLVARYARGRDYHRVLKKRCRRLMDRIREIAPDFEGRAFVDSAPVMERRLAAEAGLGWIGRNGCLIVPGLGSYVFLCEILCSLPLRPDSPLASACRDCDACVGACPTGALVDPPLVDARRCISYLTIEHREAVDPELRARMGVRLFGCDACQAACPHNRDLPPGDEEFRGDSPLGGAGIVDVLAWTWEDWDAATRGSACRRASHEMFLRNAVIAAGNSGDGSLCEALVALRERWAEMNECVSWALARLGSGDGANAI